MARFLAVTEAGACCLTAAAVVRHRTRVSAIVRRWSGGHDA